MASKPHISYTATSPNVGEHLGRLTIRSESVLLFAYRRCPSETSSQGQIRPPRTDPKDLLARQITLIVRTRPRRSADDRGVPVPASCIAAKKASVAIAGIRALCDLRL